MPLITLDPTYRSLSGLTWQVSNMAGRPLTLAGHTLGIIVARFRSVGGHV